MTQRSSQDRDCILLIPSQLDYFTAQREHSCLASPGNNNHRHQTIIHIMYKCVTTCNDVLRSCAVIDELINARDEASIDILTEAFSIDAMNDCFAEGVTVGLAGGMSVPLT